MEAFFQNGSSLDLIEVEELLLFRYKDIDYIMNLEINEGILLINKAMQERDKQVFWDMWLAKYPFMDKDTFISFNEFYEMCTMPKENKSKDEILKMAEEIERKSHEKRGEK